MDRDTGARGRRGRAADRGGRWALGLALCTGLASGGCAGGGGGGGGVISTEGKVVAQLETTLYTPTGFLLRGTIPVPPGTYPRPDGQAPLTVLDADGTPVVTQTNLVSRYARDDDGADVVEVVARVQAPPGGAPGDRVRYAVLHAPQAAPADPGTIGLEDLQATAGLPASVQALLADPAALELRAYDVFGHAYVARPLDGGRAPTLERLGALHTELRLHRTLLPETPVTGGTGTLPHLLGVHVYLSVFSGEERVGLDLRFHNAHSGRDPGLAEDDPLGDVYFERLELVLPDTWYVEGAFEDEAFGAWSASGGRRTVALVDAIGDGTMHVMRWQAQTHRRLMLATRDGRALARAYVSRGAGQGFVVPSVDPESGLEGWSWWNPRTARYFPQNHVLPSLAHMNPGTLRSEEKDLLEEIEGYLEQGLSTAGNYPVPDGRLGWAHPYGVTYGGMTGGTEIVLFDGLRLAWTASRHGLVGRQGLLRMTTDRMWTALYDADGSPSTVEDWVQPGGPFGYVPFEHFIHPNLSTGDPFGVTSAPAFQAQYVVGQGLEPAYADTLERYDAIDYQHLVRYTRTAKVLAWLGNDSLAKDELRMQAASFRLAYHPHANNAYGSVQSSGMRAAMDFVAAYPGKGFSYGRGEAWGADAVVAAYALSESVWRDRVRPWLETLAVLLGDGQARCSGFLQAEVHGKYLGGQYRARQQIEQSITESMLVGLHTTVFEKADPGHARLVNDVLRGSLRAFLSDLVWRPHGSSPPTITAVGPLDPSLPLFCTFAQLPANPPAWTPTTEAYQDWSSFAFGHELTGNPEFLRKAVLQMGAASLDQLLEWLENDGTKNLGNRAALLARMQELYGR